MKVPIIVASLILIAAVWVISIHRKLAMMKDHLGNIMGQMGTQLSALWEVLTSLSALTKSHTVDESRMLLNSLAALQAPVTADSDVADVVKQQNTIRDMLDYISSIATRAPELLSDPNYTKYMGGINNYESALHTTRLLYNDAVNQYNRTVRTFPASLFAGWLGFRPKDCLKLTEPVTPITPHRTSADDRRVS